MPSAKEQVISTQITSVYEVIQYFGNDSEIGQLLCTNQCGFNIGRIIHISQTLIA